MLDCLFKFKLLIPGVQQNFHLTGFPHRVNSFCPGTGLDVFCLQLAGWEGGRGQLESYLFFLVACSTRMAVPQSPHLRVRISLVLLRPRGSGILHTCVHERKRPWQRYPFHDFSILSLRYGYDLTATYFSYTGIPEKHNYSNWYLSLIV